MFRLTTLFISLFIFSISFAQFVPQPLKNFSPDSAGFKPGFFDAFTKELEDSSKALGAFIVWRKKGIVYEHYFHGATAESWFNIKSITKSTVSAMTGIALEKKFIADINTPVVNILPEYGKPRSVSNKGPVLFAGWLAYNDSVRRTLTLRHLLTMQHGFEWNDFGTMAGVFLNSSDPIKFSLDLPFSDTPGRKFVYCTPATSIVGAAVAKAVGTDLRSFAKKNLFDPAGITIRRWDVDPVGREMGGSEMYMTAIDMMRFGLLYLNKGKAGSKQVIARSWVEASTEAQARLDYWDILPNANGYGYFWWRRKTNGHQTFFASGACGQLIVVVPDLEMVIVAATRLDRPHRNREELKMLHVMIDKLTKEL
ncbi:serine hydrolase domain-containing protein [Longitalea arenae]|uniref:serine hydrolase domain-containing protein n=1 Tax=Longitalea arenae TaxID=2812558 RepID=UPI00196836AD|nr:serine hydrolase [Longitalea arenae]